MLLPRVPPWYKDEDEIEGSFLFSSPSSSILNLMENIFLTDGYAKIAKCWLARFDPAPPKETPPRDKADENNYEDFVIFPEEVNISWCCFLNSMCADPWFLAKKGFAKRRCCWRVYVPRLECRRGRLCTHIWRIRGG